eukprot:UN12938
MNDSVYLYFMTIKVILICNYTTCSNWLFDSSFEAFYYIRLKLVIQ